MVSQRDRLALGMDMVLDAERVLDHQFRVWRDLDEKIHNLVKLSVVGLAFGLAIATFAVSASLSLLEKWIAFSGVAAAFSVNLVALYLLAHGYSSINGTRYAECPPDVEWLLKRLRTPGMTSLVHQESLLLGMAKSVAANVSSMESVSKWRRRGVWTLAWLTLPGYWACVMVIGLFHLI